METTTINARIKQIISLKQLTISSFSREIGLINGVTISKIINQNRKPSSKTIGRIINAFPDINYEWLVNGKGSMLNGETKLRKKTINNEDLTVTSKQIIDYIENNIYKYVDEAVGKNSDSHMAEYINTRNMALKSIEELLNSKVNDTVEFIKVNYTPKGTERLLLLIDNIIANEQKSKKLFLEQHKNTFKKVKVLENNLDTLDEKISKLDMLIETIEKHNLIEREKIENFIKGSKK